jgi:hypothetical protein
MCFWSTICFLQHIASSVAKLTNMQIRRSLDTPSTGEKPTDSLTIKKAIVSLIQLQRPLGKSASASLLSGDSSRLATRSKQASSPLAGPIGSSCAPIGHKKRQNKHAHLFDAQKKVCKSVTN